MSSIQEVASSQPLATGTSPTDPVLPRAYQEPGSPGRRKGRSRTERVKITGLIC
jgi:hypothetical protein